MELESVSTSRARIQEVCPSLSRSLARSLSHTRSLAVSLSIYIYSMQVTTHLDHMSHCKAASGTNWSKRWMC